MKTLYLVTLASGVVKDVYATNPLQAAKIAKTSFLVNTKSVIKG